MNLFRIICFLLLVSSSGRAGDLVEVTATLIKVIHPAPDQLSQIELRQQVVIARNRGAEDLLKLSTVVESGKWATVKRGRQFWYPTEYSDAKVYQAAGDDGTYSVPKAAEMAPGNFTIVIPNSATKMSRTELGAAMKVRATVKEDELIYLEGQFTDMVFEGLSDEAIPIKVETKKLIRQDRVHEVMSSRIDKPMFRKVEKDFGVMLPYSAGSSRNAKLIRESQSKYTYFIPIVLGNTAFGAPGKVELKEQTASTGPIRSTMMKATKVRDFFVRSRPDQEVREHGILTLEVKKISQPTAQPGPNPAAGLIHLTSKFIESSKPLATEKPVLTAAEFGSLSADINRQKGTDILSAPSIMMASGQTGKIEVAREFIFPTEYSPPKFDAASDNKKFPAAPATPDEFEVADVGMSLAVTGVIEPGNMIRMKLKSSVLTFEGLLDFGNPVMAIKASAIKKLRPVVVSENSVHLPVFPFRETETEVLVPNGSHVAVTMVFDYHNTDLHRSRLLNIGRSKVEEVKTPRYLTVLLSPKITTSAIVN